MLQVDPLRRATVKDIRYVGDIPDHIARSPVKSLIVHMLQVGPIKESNKDIR